MEWLDNLSNGTATILAAVIGGVCAIVAAIIGKDKKDKTKPKIARVTQETDDDDLLDAINSWTQKILYEQSKPNNNAKRAWHHNHVLKIILDIILILVLAFLGAQLLVLITNWLMN